MAPAVHALSPGEAIRAAMRLMAPSKGAVLALGFSLYASLVAVCCGLGVVAAPWFLCELWALLIANGTASELPRTRAWIGAGVIQALAVLVTWSVVLVALCVLRPELLTGDAHDGAGDRVLLLMQALVAMNVAGTLVIGVSVHVQYAPAILLERGGRVVSALLESARIVSEVSALRTFVTSATAHALQVGVPLVGIAFLTTLASPLQMALYGALLFPACVASLLVGQGMIVASYVAVRPQLEHRAPGALRPTTFGMVLWCVLLFGTLSGPVAVSFAALKPVAPEPGIALAPSDVLVRLEAGPTPVESFVGDTALSVRLADGQASVVASDGGGAGRIPVDGNVRALRLARDRTNNARALAEQHFAVELVLEDGRVFITHVDEAGVRRDDSVERRIAARLRVLPASLLFCALLWAALWVAQALPAQARALHRFEAVRPDDPSYGLRALRKTALVAALWLAPATLVSWWVAMSVLAR